MLVLGLKKEDRVVINGSITITIVNVDSAKDRVQLGIDAPHDVPIRRGELEAFSNEDQQPTGEQSE